eukprot:3629_1
MSHKKSRKSRKDSNTNNNNNNRNRNKNNKISGTNYLDMGMKLQNGKLFFNPYQFGKALTLGIPVICQTVASAFIPNNSHQHFENNENEDDSDEDDSDEDDSTVSTLKPSTKPEIPALTTTVSVDKNSKPKPITKPITKQPILKINNIDSPNSQTYDGDDVDDDNDNNIDLSKSQTQDDDDEDPETEGHDRNLARSPSLNNNNNNNKNNNNIRK